MVEAEERLADVRNMLNRNHAVTGRVRGFRRHNPHRKDPPLNDRRTDRQLLKPVGVLVEAIDGSRWLRRAETYFKYTIDEKNSHSLRFNAWRFGKLSSAA